MGRGFPPFQAAVNGGAGTPAARWFSRAPDGGYAAYAAESVLDSITQYELWKAIWSSLNDRNLFELAYALGW